MSQTKPFFRPKLGQDAHIFCQVKGQAEEKRDVLFIFSYYFCYGEDEEMESCSSERQELDLSAAVIEEITSLLIRSV